MLYPKRNLCFTEHHVAPRTPRTPAALAEVGLRGLLDLGAGPTAPPTTASAEPQ